MVFSDATALPTSGLYKVGSKGAAVTQIQQALTTLGYPVQIDGAYGTETFNAVRAFQRAAGIGIDGIVGPETLGALRVALERDATYPDAPSVTATRADATTPAAPTKGGGLGWGLYAVPLVVLAGLWWMNRK